MPATPSEPAAREGGYRPLPVVLVDELERLTREREHPGADGTPAQADARQKRIDEIVAQLRCAPSAARGDMVVGARLVRILGKGNFGVVWEAVDDRTGEPRAVKVFDLDRLGLGLSLYHFRRGAVAMDHLNRVEGRPSSVVRLYEVEASRLAFAMQYLDGKDLTNVARRGWSLAAKVEAFETICHAVKFAHENEVIHRDIKPANIVMTADGQAVLTDFDIADLLFVKTMSAAAGGTTFYAAPEQLAGEGSRDVRCDVYSLGRLLHFLLTEKDPPFVDAVPRLEDLSSQPEGLRAIVRQCTMRDPSLRYPDIDALLADVARHETEPRTVGRDADGLETNPAARRRDAELSWNGAERHATEERWADSIECGKRAIELIAAIGELPPQNWRDHIHRWSKKIDDEAGAKAYAGLARRYWPISVISLALAVVGVVAIVKAMTAHPVTQVELAVQMNAILADEQELLSDFSTWHVYPSPRAMVEHATLDDYFGGQIEVVDGAPDVVVDSHGPPYGIGVNRYAEAIREYSRCRDRMIKKLHELGIRWDDYATKGW